MSGSYHEQVANIFLSSPIEEFGDAHATAAELGALRELYIKSGKDRDVTLYAISDSGYPLPEQVTPEEVALSGAAHACGVAIDLAVTRGIEGKDATYESYTVKNRFDRFVAMHLPKHLRTSWDEPIERQQAYINPKIVYPDGVNDSLIHGIAKPHRYFPAQTMRYLEFARLGKLDDKTAEQFSIHAGTDLSTFGVKWDLLIPTIEGSNDLLQLSADISCEVARQLIHNGLKSEQVAAVLKKGYSLDGMKSEHGEIQQTKDVYLKLIDKLRLSPDTEPVADILMK